MSEVAPLNDTCPRCGGSFHCGAQDGHCDCFELKLTPEVRERVAREYDDCLCVKCLRELAQQQAPLSAAKNRSSA